MTSQTVFNAVLANGLHNKKLAPYLGLASVEKYIKTKSNIYIIEENQAFEGSSDIRYIDESISKLDYLVGSGWQKTSFNCGYLNVTSYIFKQPF